MILCVKNKKNNFGHLILKNIMKDLVSKINAEFETFEVESLIGKV